jgi:2-hydroxy-3-oxopropionate reductase
MKARVGSKILAKGDQIPEKLGFVGLGIMGRPMARNLVRAGYELVLYNRTRSKAQELAAELGAKVAEIPKEVASSSGVIFTMLPGPPEVEEVVAGEDGLLEGAGEGSLIIDKRTSSPVLARQLASIARERGVGMLDAPVSGATWGLKRGRSRSWSAATRRTSANHDRSRMDISVSAIGRRAANT